MKKPFFIIFLLITILSLTSCANSAGNKKLNSTSNVQSPRSRASSENQSSLDEILPACIQDVLNNELGVTESPTNITSEKTIEGRTFYFTVCGRKCEAQCMDIFDEGDYTLLSIADVEAKLTYYWISSPELKNKVNIYDLATGKLISEKTEDVGTLSDAMSEYNRKSEEIMSNFDQALSSIALGD